MLTNSPFMRIDSRSSLHFESQPRLTLHSDVSWSLSQPPWGGDNVAQEDANPDFLATSLIDVDDLPIDLPYNSLMADTRDDMSVALSQIRQNINQVDSATGNPWNSNSLNAASQQTIGSWVSDMIKSLFRPQLIPGYRRVEWACVSFPRYY